MKIIHWILNIALLGLGYVVAEDFTECSRALLESFDLDGEDHILPYKNEMCPMISNNCCNYSAQIQIYKKFILAKEKDRIENFYKEFSGAYEEIFEALGEVEQVAQTVKQRTEDFPGSNCNKYARSIEYLNASKLYPFVKAAVKRAYEFLFKAREGFYCSICDAKTQRWFNITESEIHVTYGFCGKMVEETLNYFLFKYGFFMKVSRLYSTFVRKCDLHGRYNKNRFVKAEIKFYRRDKVLTELELCEKGYNEPGAMNGCSKFCSRFNPVKFDEFLEGEVDKLFAFGKTLKEYIQTMNHKYEREVKLEEERQRLGRVLADKKKKVKETVRLDEDINEINQFNREFKAALIRPITYVYDEDLFIKYHVNFEESLFAAGVETIYNLADYKVQVSQNGTNFYTYGEGSAIEKDSAMKVFELMNPANAKKEEEFNKMLQG